MFINISFWKSCLSFLLKFVFQILSEMIHQLGKKVFWFPTFSQDKRNYFWYLVWKTILQISSFLCLCIYLSWNFVCMGGSLNHVDGFLDFFDHPPPPMWIILLNKGYVLMWIFREPPLPPWSSTWFKDPPKYKT